MNMPNVNREENTHWKKFLSLFAQHTNIQIRELSMGRVRQHTQNDALTTDTNENGKLLRKNNIEFA